MSLKSTPELHAFFSTYFPDADPEADDQTARAFLAASSADRLEKVISQAKGLLEDDALSTEELGLEANRWFSDAEEVRAWLRQLLAVLEGEGSAKTSVAVTVKDSNGTPLAEGDAVQVIKDLKVKGGSSDLKRGTLIKKIHLTEDPEAIECRVEGSTLVLKTCFLKKA